MQLLCLDLAFQIGRIRRRLGCDELYVRQYSSPLQANQFAGGVEE
jgi:hypothetical protein